MRKASKFDASVRRKAGWAAKELAELEDPKAGWDLTMQIVVAGRLCLQRLAGVGMVGAKETREAGWVGDACPNCLH